MAAPDEDELNPYRPPEASPSPGNEPVRAAIDPEVVREFRRQIHALGGLWIIGGTLALTLAVAGLGARGGLWANPAPDFFSEEVLILLAVLAVAGAVYLPLGVAACLKHTWAVTIGVVLSYLSLLNQLAGVNVCSLVILILIILQAHRVIRRA